MWREKFPVEQEERSKIFSFTQQALKQIMVDCLRCVSCQMILLIDDDHSIYGNYIISSRIISAYLHSSQTWSSNWFISCQI